MKLFIAPLAALALMFGGLAYADHDTVCPAADEIAEAAHSLSEVADHFHEFIHDVEGYSHLAGHAHQFAAIAEQFHVRIHQEELSCPDIRFGFYQVENSYYGLKRAFRQAHEIHHDAHAQQDFQQVVDAYHVLERQVYSVR